MGLRAMSFQMSDIDNGQRFVMGRRQVHRRRNTHLTRFFPTRRAQAPFVAGLKAWKAKLWARRDQIIPAMKTILQEIRRDGHADRVHPVIHRTRIAAAIPEKAGKWVVTAGRKRFAEHVAGGFSRLCHVAAMASGLLAADFNTPQ